jgi:Fe2+ transport system protein FeoA
MPKSPEEATTKEVQYPDDLPGEKWTIVEYAYYDAQDEDDAEELPEAAQYGWWLRVRPAGRDSETWASAPRDLREKLLELGLEEGDTFEVYELKKGPGDHDPYHAEVDQWTEGDPS